MIWKLKLDKWKSKLDFTKIQIIQSVKVNYIHNTVSLGSILKWILKVIMKKNHHQNLNHSPRMMRNHMKWNKISKISQVLFIPQIIKIFKVKQQRFLIDTIRIQQKIIKTVCTARTTCFPIKLLGLKPSRMFSKLTQTLQHQKDQNINKNLVK